MPNVILLYILKYLLVFALLWFIIEYNKTLIVIQLQKSKGIVSLLVLAMEALSCFILKVVGGYSQGIKGFWLGLV